MGNLSIFQSKLLKHIFEGKCTNIYHPNIYSFIFCIFMKTLAIETSCDDTSVGIVDFD